MAQRLDPLHAPAPAASPVAAPLVASPPATSFHVACICGQAMSGQRGAMHQILPCPACGGNVFVLPLGPWHQAAASATRAAPPGLRWRDWMLLAMACTVALLVLVIVYNVWFGAVRPGLKNGANSHAAETKAQLLERLDQAKSQLAEGGFRLAQLTLAPADRKLDLSLLGKEEKGEWQQLASEAAVCADLLAEPLEEIVRHAAATRGPEWAADFRLRYEGKSLLFDAEFRPAGDGKWQMLYPLFASMERVRLAVDDLKLLQRVPPHEPQRLVVGVRLASVKLEPPGPSWVVRFLPDSGVFITNAGAARLCPPLGEPDGQAVLERQRRWALPE